MGRKKHRKKRKKTCFCYSSELGNRSSCNTIIALSLFLILIIVITIGALAIYIGMEIILDGTLRVTYGDYYTTELYNRTSQIFLSKAHAYKIMIEKVFAKSLLGPSVKQCIIMGFKNGSLIIFYRLILDRRKIPSRTYANIEETAKKILYDEITMLKSTVFTNVRLDPKQIVLRKHSPNADTPDRHEHVESSSTEDAAISNINSLGVLKRLSHTTVSPIVRKRLPIAAATPAPVPSSVTTRAKISKKPRPPSVEKNNKMKHPSDSLRSSNNNAHRTMPNFDINGSANRYSFVSEDNSQHSSALVSAKNTSAGLGEAKVITLPAEVEPAARSADETELKTDDAPIIEGLYSPSAPQNPTTSKNGASTSTESVIKAVEKEVNLTTTLPTRSNVALNRPLRPKPQINAKIPVSVTTTSTLMSTPTTNRAVLGKSTTENVIVLNTEVVTSTSMQISYGQNSALKEPVEDTRNSPEITHNIRSVYELTKAPNQQKYKNIFPRSIRDESFRNQSIDTGKSSLSSIIEKYKKHPSNESLQLILEHLALMYTKSTLKSSASSGEKLSPSKGYNSLLMTRPMNKISTTTPTTTTTKYTTEVLVDSDCGEGSKKRCDNGQCIAEHLWCNQFSDCSDGSDEKNCTCADYLKAQFEYKKICDGIVDCWDFSDENLCGWCSPEMYVCTNAKLCIKQNKVCDGVRDCPLGDDEKNCITITQFEKNNGNDVIYQSKGIITVRRAGIWGKLCFEDDENVKVEEKTNKVSELGKAVCKTMTFRNFSNLTVIDDTKNEVVPVYYKLTDVVRNDTNSLRRKNFKFVKTSCRNKRVVQISCENLECGIQTQIGKGRAHGKYSGERRSRIVGGGSATLGAWPWQAALYKEGEFQCGATLISNKWLLSAGHCFNNALRDYWVARLGILRRSSTLPSPHEQIRPIQRILVHPHYADADFINDISLLEMSSEVYMTNFVRPICFPNLNWNPPDGTLCTVIGWGQIVESGGVYPDTLQEVQLPVMSPAECRKRTVFLPLYKITDGMLCAGFDRGGRDACLGDSGGPLMCHENDDSWHLYGVTSNGNGCARAHRPGVYTKVTNYLNWIDSHLRSAASNASNPKTMTPVCNGFRCPLGECLPKARICNGFMECSDGSDERAC